MIRLPASLSFDAIAQNLPLSLPSALPGAAMAEDALPSWNELMHWSTRLTHLAVVAGIALAIGLALHLGVYTLLRRLWQRSGREIAQLAAQRLYHATRWAVVVTSLGMADNFDRLLRKLWVPVAQVLVPAITGWVLYALLQAFADILVRSNALIDDEMSGRSRHTRITILARAGGFLIIFLTIAMMLLTVPAVRHVGATLMASAGLIGLAVGAAAQPALKSLIAGLQIVLTEPIRIGDFVVVEGESGRVEDIRLSYVVIRTGDERRLIVPTTKILDSSFQNWTRVGGITGSVVLPIRPGFAISAMRDAYLTLLTAQPEWDGRSGELQVAEARVGSVELKLIMSAADPTALASLRFAMREAMLEWLRETMPDALCTET
ncbi:mechanosensitive ion channel [Novosphingobium sp. FSY-8]|uniref:Mechanosensitive ion channel n=1 Tax=Novosphingobium ovatum TaxID=1908523 RepID=A0ABW9XEW1_9SPHN|nr:mechanosensitive ion channel domain-containing protein [Novosphingobium ovatum]NBC37072.1 mechanosensitive ion channel [Novosphingobium ovatum]